MPLGPNDVRTASAIAALFVRYGNYKLSIEINLPLAAIMFDVLTSFSFADVFKDSPLWLLGIC